MVLGAHYHETLHCLGYNNSSIDELIQLKQKHLHVTINREDYSDHEVEIQNEAMEFRSKYASHSI